MQRNPGQKALAVLLSLCFILTMVSPLDARESRHRAVSSDYLVGAGIYDITGPAAEVIMMGYANPEQMTGGIHTRLRSRAFIIADPASGQRVVLVNADLGQIFAVVKKGVIQKLKAYYGDLYDYDNVLITATHTHNGPGGYSSYTLYNFSILGFNKQNYDCIVDGIVKSIQQAHDNLEPGSILVNSGKCEGTTINRSLPAYMMNPAEERARYRDDVDKSMILLKLVDSSGSPIGMINWFAIHGTSMGKDNLLISGDNKGYAEYLFEKEMGTDYGADKTFVAAFAISSAGDVSPNIYGGQEGYGANDFESTAYAGRTQFQTALELFDSASDRVRGNIDYRHQFVDMSAVQIDGFFTDRDDQSTVPAAVGYSFAAGAEDGPSDLPFFHEGMTQDDYSQKSWLGAVQRLIGLVPFFGPVVGTLNSELWELHDPKPVLFSTSQGVPDPWTPDVLGVQVLKVGQITILGLPSEITTMAGRRLEESVAEVMDAVSADGIVVIASLANGYAQYVATPEEYMAQNYEGASTLFGKYTLPAYIQIFHGLAAAIVNDDEVDPGVVPRDPANYRATLQPPVVFDAVPLGKKFGQLVNDVRSEYSRGEEVEAVFRAGHPKNDLKTQSSFLRVERWEEDQWVPVAYDWDWDTIFRWKRTNLALGYSQAIIKWQTNDLTPPGEYRIVHEGSYKLLTGKIKPYSGTSSTFIIE